MKDISTVHIIGMGALGMFLGAQIMEARPDADVRFVMDPARYEKHKDDVHKVNGELRDFPLLSTDDQTAADLIILTVKYPSMESALDVMAGSVGDGTVILSAMNGITTEKILSDRFGEEHVIYAVAGGMDAMSFGTDLTFTQRGWLQLGMPDTDDDPRVARVYDFLKVMPMNVQDLGKGIVRAMWYKFMVNVSINQTCMVFDADYEKALEKGSVSAAINTAAMREVIALANAEGVDLGEADMITCLNMIAGLDPHATPSMGQDRINKKPSEVDLFAGVVIDMADKYGIPVPANECLYKGAREAEKEYL